MTITSARRGRLAALAGAAAALMLAATPLAGSAQADDSGTAKREPATFMVGTVVNPSTGAAVGGIRVTLRDVVSMEVLGTDVTDSSGRWRVNDLTEDEYAVKFAGRPKGYETGFLGCGHGVVPTWGEACSFGTGRVGIARLEKL